MKEVLSVLTFGIGAVCFVVFFTVLKPHAFSALAGPSSLNIATRKLRSR